MKESYNVARLWLYAEAFLLSFLSWYYSRRSVLQRQQESDERAVIYRRNKEESEMDTSEMAIYSVSGVNVSVCAVLPHYLFLSVCGCHEVYW